MNYRWKSKIFSRWKSIQEVFVKQNKNKDTRFWVSSCMHLICQRKPLCEAVLSAANE